jgi:hypothetical protein
MGRTQYNYRDEDDDRRKTKQLKRSKNIPGKGMRVINNWSEDEDDYKKFSYDESDEYYENTSQTQRK